MIKNITKRSQDYSKWYLDVIEAAELAEHAPVKGCMIIKPYGYAIWEQIQRVLNDKIKEFGAKNVYFPLLIPQHYLAKEAAHIKGFVAECAVVTHGGGKKLTEPLIIRPTSETIIYKVFSKWIQSYRDLPLIINQWANVVRWELRPRLFLRTIEFLWQEGHGVFATQREADDNAHQALCMYRLFTEQYLALPVVSGIKSEQEKFAGALRTYCIEAMMQDGKALQTGTSHFLGQNFARSFNVLFCNKNGKSKYVWQNSWGVSTRLIGAIIMAHSDDKGLVLPPQIAPVQVIILPVLNLESQRYKVLAEAESLEDKLEKCGLKTIVDKRDMRLGPKLFEWEQKGVPIRVEIGSEEVKKKGLLITRRDTCQKTIIPNSSVVQKIPQLLQEIQQNLYDKSLKRLAENTKKVDRWTEFMAQIKKGFALAHWCNNSKCEKKIKEKTKATVRCIPFDQKKEKGTCIICGRPSSKRVIFAKAY